VFQVMGGLRLKFEGGKVLYKDREIKKIGLLAGGSGEHGDSGRIESRAP
jgi:hypothetical protein